MIVTIPDGHHTGLISCDAGSVGHLGSDSCRVGFLDGSASSVGLFGGVTGSVSLLGGAASSVGFLDNEGVVVSLKGQGDGNKLSSAIPCGGGAKGRYTWIYPLPSDGYRSICFTSDIFLIF